jgi:hypothetical protein
MLRASPESVFALAQSAMERGDWEGFFGCLDRTDLKKLARLGISPVGEDPQGAYARFCIDYGVPVEQLEEVKSLLDAIQASARQMVVFACWRSLEGGQPGCVVAAVAPAPRSGPGLGSCHRRLPAIH